MTKYTPRGYPVPDSYDQPADVPSALDDLATAVDTDVQGIDNNKAPLNHNHDTRYPRIWYQTSQPVAPGLGIFVVDFGTLAAGQEKEQSFGVPTGAYVLCSVQHPSTYILAVANLTDDTNVTIRVRNSTTQTEHTNVKVHVLVVKA